MMIEAASEHLAFVAPERRANIENLLLASPISHSCFVDGDFIGMFGVIGFGASLDGVIWLYVDDKQRSHSQIIARTALRELRRVAPMFRKIASAVDADNDRDIAFARFLGFETGEARAVGDRAYREMIYEGAL